MAKITINQALQMAANAGFRGSAQKTITAIAICESGLKTDAIGPLGEVGILQIYPKAHPTIPRSCMLDPQCSFNVAYSDISNKGTNFNPWTTYRNGCYRQYIAMIDSGSPSSTPLVGSTLTLPNNPLKPGDDLTLVLGAIDQVFEVFNPFAVPVITDSTDIPLAGKITLPDYVDWFTQVGTNFITDLRAIILRTVLVLLGFLIIYKIVASPIISGGQQTMGKVLDAYSKFSGMASTTPTPQPSSSSPSTPRTLTPLSEFLP